MFKLFFLYLMHLVSNMLKLIHKKTLIFKTFRHRFYCQSLCCPQIPVYNIGSIIFQTYHLIYIILRNYSHFEKHLFLENKYKVLNYTAKRK